MNNTAGSGTGTGAVTVNAGGTLGGTGTIAGTVAVSGTITAGANNSTGIGTLTTGAETWNASGGLLAKVAAAGTSNDKLVLSGLTVAATSAAPFTVTATGAFTFTATGTQLLLATDTATTGPNPFAAALAAGTLTLSSNTTVAPVSGDAVALTTSQDGGGFELYLSDVAAPEPTSLLLAGVAAVPLALGRRRRIAR